MGTNETTFRERDRQTLTDRHTDRQRDRQTDTKRDTERQIRNNNK